MVLTYSLEFTAYCCQRIFYSMRSKRKSEKKLPQAKCNVRNGAFESWRNQNLINIVAYAIDDTLYWISINLSFVFFSLLLLQQPTPNIESMPIVVGFVCVPVALLIKLFDTCIMCGREHWPMHKGFYNEHRLHPSNASTENRGQNAVRNFDSEWKDVKCTGDPRKLQLTPTILSPHTGGVRYDDNCGHCYSRAKFNSLQVVCASIKNRMKFLTENKYKHKMDTTDRQIKAIQVNWKDKTKWREYVWTDDTRARVYAYACIALKRRNQTECFL